MPPRSKTNPNPYPNPHHITTQILVLHPILLLLLLLLFLLPSFASAHPTLSPRDSNPNPFIVVMKQNVSSRSSSFKKHLSWIRDLDRNASAPSSLSSDVGAIGRFQWYSGSFDYDTLAKINQSNVVECVIEDTLFKLQEKVQQGPPSWGLDRIDQRSGLDGLFHFPSSSGAGVNVYVIDTGINIEHTDFVGRASYGPSFIGNESDPTDTNGHGTFVAGVCCGTNYGVAKKANVISVKALNSDGSGRLSNVLAALSWVVEQHTTSGNTSKTVVNLSLGAEYSEVTNNAIEQAIEQGIHFTIASGNDGADACQYSPASVSTAMTVGATNRDDSIASYSNTGSCVDIYAPGSGVTSLGIGSNHSTQTLSGTSMASPHVAGLMALLLAENNVTYTPATLISKIKSIATTIVFNDTNTDSISETTTQNTTLFVYVDGFDDLALAMFASPTATSVAAGRDVTAWWCAWVAIVAGVVMWV